MLAPFAPSEELARDGSHDACREREAEHDLGRGENDREPEQQGVAEEDEGGQNDGDPRHAARTIL